MIETKEQFTNALERLRRRDSESLAAFILSLAQDSGPVGEHVRTFIVGDDVGEVVESIEERIGDLRTASEYEHRHARGKEIGEKLALIVDAVERLVLPVNPKAAFQLLVKVFEADREAMENCGDHDWEVQCSFKRAAELMAEAGKGMPREEVGEKIKALMADDEYGVRQGLSAVLGKADDVP
jgi:hypothetical protein